MRWSYAPIGLICREKVDNKTHCLLNRNPPIRRKMQCPEDNVEDCFDTFTSSRQQFSIAPTLSDLYGREEQLENRGTRQGSLQKTRGSQGINYWGDQRFLVLPGEQINDPSPGKYFSYISLSNSLVFVSDPGRAFFSSGCALQGPLTRLVHCFSHWTTKNSAYPL